MLHLNEQFEHLIAEIQGCTACPSMEGCTRVLSWANGAPGAEIMFVGEAPGRLGADRTSVPFHGDVAGDNFERLLKLSGLSRRQIFVTNAVLCNPRDDKGNNAPPSKSVLIKCAANLQKQIQVVQPLIVVTLGSAALEATRVIENHGLTLRHDVRTSHRWNNVDLIPLYHPGARAMIHRNFALQSADYYFLGEFTRRKSKKRSPSKPASSRLEASWNVVRYVIAKLSPLSLFRLHKFFYLLDYKSLEQRGQAVTDFVYIRQKDGPYCVELGSRWFKDHQEEIEVTFKNKIPFVHWRNASLFSTAPELNIDDRPAIDELIDELASLSDAQLKTKAYLTDPMRKALIAERNGVSRLNMPLL
jgi:uracil-DNA glycosylase family 4